MMVYKQHLGWDGVKKISLPEGARVVHYAIQDFMPTLWYEFDETRPLGTVERRFITVGTGQPTYCEKVRHLGTAISEIASGVYVWHLYEVEA